MMDYKKIVPYFIIFLMPVIQGCKTKNTLPSSKEEIFKINVPKSTYQDDDTAILFLTCLLDKENNISVVNYKIRPGIIKRSRTLPISKKGLFYQLEDTNNQMIYIQYISNPLVYNTESLSDNGSFQRNEIVLEKAEFTIRTNIDPTITKIRIGRDQEHVETLLEIQLLP